jgi:hypothetical protein
VYHPHNRMTKYVRNAEGSYVCPYADCSFTAKPQNPSTMHYHIKTHVKKETGVGKYACDQCDKAFIQKSGLTQHVLQIHTENAPTWACPHPSCDHAARSKANIMIHFSRSHCDDWIPRYSKSQECSGCSKTFQSAGAYYYHAVGCCTVPESVEPLLATLQ